MILLQSQKNDLFDCIEDAGLSPAQFSFSQSPSEVIPNKTATVLNFNKSEFYYKFDTGRKGNHFAIFSPAEEKFADKQYPGPWRLQLDYFHNWLNYLKREIEAPDKWARLNDEILKLDMSNEESQSQFTAQEFEEVNRKIEFLKERISEHELLTEYQDVVNSKLDFLIDQAKVMTKFDWKSLFIGTIISITIQLSVNEESANALWGIIKEVFNQFLLN